MIRNFSAMSDQDPKYLFRIRSSLGMTWFRQLRIDQIWIKTTSRLKILFMLANKLIKSGCGSGAEMIRNFFGYVRSRSEIFVLDLVQFRYDLVSIVKTKSGPDVD
jgi:hypothetical protein